jgi:replicative DNA helicase
MKEIETFDLQDSSFLSVALFINQFYQQYNFYPDVKDFLGERLEDEDEYEKRQEIFGFIEDFSSNNDFDNDSLTEIKREFYAHKHQYLLKNIVDEMSVRIADGMPIDKTQALQILRQAYVEGLGAQRNFGSVDGTDYKKGVSRIVFPMSTLDSATGSFYGEELFILAGATGSGKTFQLIDIGVKCAFMGYKVLLLSFEMSWDDLNLRALSCIGEFSTLGVRKRIEKDITASSVARLIYNETCVGVLDMPDDYFDNMQQVEDLILSNDYDLILLDSPYLASQKQDKNTQGWEAKDDLVKNLKKLARRTKKPILCTMQVSGSKMNGLDIDNVSKEDLAFAKSMTFHADFVGIMVKESFEDKPIHLMRTKFVKNRHGEENLIIEAEANFAQGNIIYENEKRYSEFLRELPKERRALCL